MLLLICVGILCYKQKIITAQANKSLSELALRVVIPVVILTAYQTDFSPQLLHGLITAFVLSIASFVIQIFLAYALVPKRGEYIIERFSAIYSNCGFMGFPLINGVFGSEGILYATAYLTMFNLLVWSHGVMMISGNMSLKGFLSTLKSPTIIATVLGLVLYLFGIRFPDTISKTLEHISSLNTPIPMLVAGVTIAQTNILKALKKPRLLFVCLLRLLILPMITVLVLQFIPADNTVFMSVMLTAACPTATICTLFSIKYGKNDLYASEIFAVCTILSAITMPLLIAFMNVL